MKRTLIALGVAAAVVAPLANAAPTVYGRLNVTVQNVDVDNDPNGDKWEVSSNASRFGVKGEEKLTDSVSAVYQIEWEISGSGSETDMAQRNRFLGLKHADLGTLKAGKIDTLIKQAEGKVDQFGDLTNADIENVIGAQAGPARPNNVIEYNSPKIADLVNFNVQLIQNEGVNANGFTAKDNGLADGVSSSIVLSSGPFWATVAYEQDVVARASSRLVNGSNGWLADTIRVAGTYDLKDLGLSLGALYQQSEFDNDGTVITTSPEEKGFIVSAAQKFGKNWTGKLQYGQSTLEQRGLSDVDLTNAVVGVDYSLAKTTKVFGYYSVRNVDNKIASTDIDTNTFAIGLQHNF